MLKENRISDLVCLIRCLTVWPCYDVFMSRVIGSDPWHIIEVATEITSHNPHHPLVANYRIIRSRQSASGYFLSTIEMRRPPTKRVVCKTFDHWWQKYIIRSSRFQYEHCEVKPIEPETRSQCLKSRVCLETEGSKSEWCLAAALSLEIWPQTGGYE